GFLRRVRLTRIEAANRLLSLEVVPGRVVLASGPLHAHVAHFRMKLGAAADVALELAAGPSALARGAAFFLHLPDQFVVGVRVAFGHRLSPFPTNGIGQATVPNVTPGRVGQAFGRGAEAMRRSRPRLPAGRAGRRLPRDSASLDEPAWPWGEPG